MGYAVINTPEGVEHFHMLAQYQAARLQLLGMRHSSGRSVIAHIKKTYGLKGTNASVVEQFKALIDERFPK